MVGPAVIVFILARKKLEIIQYGHGVRGHGVVCGVLVVHGLVHALQVFVEARVVQDVVFLPVLGLPEPLLHLLDIGEELRVQDAFPRPRAEHDVGHVRAVEELVRPVKGRADVRSLLEIARGRGFGLEHQYPGDAYRNRYEHDDDHLPVMPG